MKETVVVERIVPGGLGLARDAHGVLFVRGALPGERVEVELPEGKAGKRARHARLLRVLEPSSQRATPDCALHPRCGGCDFLDLSSEAQRAAKRDMVLDALVRVGKLPSVGMALPAEAPADLALSGRRRARFRVAEGGALTFSEREGHERVPIEHCPALHPTLDAALARIRAARLPRGLELRLAVDDRAHVSAALANDAGAAARALVGAGAVHGVVLEDGTTFGDPLLLGEIAPGVDAGPYASDAGVFTQATRFGSRAILDGVMGALAREGAVAAGTRVLELFAGAGHLTMPLVRAGYVVDAVEGDARAVAFLVRNLAQATSTAAPGGMSSAKAAGSARVAFIDGALSFEPHDVIVADPPRTGIPGFADLLTRSPARTLVMVSCDVATGARDLGAAVRAGFELRSFVSIDAFPRTSHVETVASLSRSARL